MPTWLAQVLAAIVGLVGALWGAAGLTAEMRLARRAQRLLDLADRVPQLGLRARLRAAATDDARRALTMRTTGPSLAGGVALGVVSTLAVFFFIPWWVTRHPDQGSGWQGTTWIVIFWVYVAAMTASWTFVILMLRLRARPAVDRGTGAAQRSERDPARRRRAHEAARLRGRAHRSQGLAGRGGRAGAKRSFASGDAMSDARRADS